MSLLLLDSCSKEKVVLNNDIDPFAIENTDDTQTRNQLDGSLGGTAIVDPDEGDEDMDEDDDKIVDPDGDDDDAIDGMSEEGI